MPDHYDVKPLEARTIDQAFPLVQTRFPKISLDRWRAYAAELIGAPTSPRRRGRAVRTNVVVLPQPPSSGVVTVQLSRGYMHGLFAYQVLPSPCHGRVLQVDLFIAHDLFDPGSTAEALLREMERIARQHRCEAVHMTLPERPEDPQLDRIIDLGHVSEGVRLCKSIAAAE